MLLVGVACLALEWYPETWPLSDFVGDLYANAATSLLSISATVLLIDRANEQRDRVQLKKRLIWEMGSSDKALAIRAVKEMRDEGWLTDGSLRDADLTGANLERAQLDGASLEGAIFSGSNLKWARLERADLRRAILEGATAERVNLRNARLTGVSLRSARLPSAILEGIDGGGEIDMMGASLIRASLRGAKLGSAQLEECDFFEADLSGADLSGAQLLRAIVTGAILDEVNLERADLSELQGWKEIKSLREARISGIRNAPEGFREWAVEQGAIDASGRESRQTQASK
ncbi:pentapeptide repeat-containing protein [Microbispora sitophila]|uniref:pentapeptide repeat-containing protein n=1 Tax=Microbispora sitophila TaxID=2771537 RepID=UPI001D016798|nr:pentapeptide repeat-containing protein [Microbispora sitophila]